MTIQELNSKLQTAISEENYELAGEIKTQIEAANSQTFVAPEPEIGQVEQLYQENHEVFTKESHDTVSKKFEHKGVVSNISNIREDILESFPHEGEMIQMTNPKTGEGSRHWSLMYGMKEMPVSVKQGYVPHTREDLITLCESARDAFDGEVKLSTAFKNGHYISIQPTDQYRRSIFGTDTVNPRLIIEAPMGGGSFQTSMGWYRDVCRNLTWLKSVSVVSESIRHSKSLPERRDELVETFSIVAQSWEKSVEFMQLMDQRELKIANVIQEIMGDRPEKRVKQYDQKIRDIVSIIEKERLKTGRKSTQSATASAWELFNAFQGISQHKKTRKGSPTGFSRAVLAAKDSEVNFAEKTLFAEIINPVLVA